MTPTVRVVVLNHDGGELTFECLRSVLATRWPAPNLQVVLVDNASTDGVVARVRDELPVVRVEENAANLGFAGGCNTGLRDLDRVDFVALLNNDAAADRGWLAPLVDTLAADPTLGAACPKVVLPDGVIDNVGVDRGPYGRGSDRGHGQVDRGQLDRPADVFAWCGAAVLLRADYVRDVGLLDERLFLYCEDLEHAWRGRARGWRYRTVPASVVRHRHSATVGEGSELQRFYNLRNALLVALRHADGPTVAAASSRSVAAFARAALRRADDAAVRGRALAGFARLAPAMLRSRRDDRRRPGYRHEIASPWRA